MTRRSRLIWAVLLVAGTLGGGDAYAQAPTPPKHKAAKAATCADADLLPAEANLAAVRRATLCLLNLERTLQGRPALRSSADLAEVADDFARTMVVERFFAHVSPGGSTLVTRVKQSSYLQGAAGWALAENIGWGTGSLSTPGRTVAAWMRSAPHRRIILDTRFREIGVGVAYGTPSANRSGATYTTEFGARISASPR